MRVSCQQIILRKIYEHDLGTFKLWFPKQSFNIFNPKMDQQSKVED